MKRFRRVLPPSSGLILIPIFFDIFILFSLFFFLGSTFLFHSGIQVKVPSSPFFVSSIQNPIVVGISGMPKPSILFLNKSLTLAELAQTLPTLCKPATAIIKADETAPHGLVIGVSNLFLEAGFPVVISTDERRTPIFPNQQPR